MAKENQYITLDCAPGYPRPDDLIAGVIEGTGLPTKEKDYIFFGEARWSYYDIDEQEWKRIQEITKPRIVALYNQGLIRYGDW